MPMTTSFPVACVPLPVSPKGWVGGKWIKASLHCYVTEEVLGANGNIVGRRIVHREKHF